MVAIEKYYQRGKNLVHALQGLLIFLGAIVTIAIFAKGGKGDGRINYYFVLCFLSIPILIYQTAIPIFPRVKRFSHAYVHAVLDAVWMILWFAAFIAVAVWVHDGSHAAKDWKSGDSSCEVFAWGPVGKCKLGKATIGMGVVIWLLFLLTTAISVYGAYYFRSHGALPSSPIHTAEPIDAEDSDNYAFSTNQHDKFIAPDELQDMHSDHGHSHSNSEDHPPIPPGHDIESHPHPHHSNSPLNWEPEPILRKPIDRDFGAVDTSYHPSHASPPSYNITTATTDPSTHLPLPPPSPLSHRIPSPLSNRGPSPQQQHYETIHSNESHFIGGGGGGGNGNGMHHQPPSPLSTGRTPSPGYEAHILPLRNNSFTNDPRFAPQVLQAGSAGQINFPEGAYGRVGVFDRDMR